MPSSAPPTAGRPRRYVRVLAAVGVLALVTWLLLHWLGRPAGWLVVEAPRYAMAGRPLRLRVRLGPQPAKTRLGVDLHWDSARHESRGYLAGAPPQAVRPEGGVYEFEVTVKETEGLAHVHGVIYLSPTGIWRHQSRAVVTDPIPVKAGPRADLEPPLVRWPAHPAEDDPGGSPAESLVPRGILASLLLASAALGGRVLWRRPPLALEGARQEVRWWRALTLMLLAAALWELLGLEAALGDRLRAIAQAGDVYYARETFQRTLTSVLVAATAGLILLAARARMSPALRGALLGFGLYAGIAALRLVSLHVIDKLAGLASHGVTVALLLKVAGALVVLRHVAWGWGGRPPGGHAPS